MSLTDYTMPIMARYSLPNIQSSTLTAIIYFPCFSLYSTITFFLFLEKTIQNILLLPFNIY